MPMLQDKVILIVGGATGIGRAAARLCRQQGAALVIADLVEEEGQKAAEESGGLFFAVDITDESQVAGLAQKVAAACERVDVLIITAGILQGAFVPLDEFSVDTFRRVWDVNVTGTFLIAKYITPLLKKSARGVVILTSSGAATGGSSSFAYGASKGGVSSFAITLANRLESDGIRVNVLSPGNIDTAMKRSVIAADAERRGADFEQSVADSRLGTPEGIAKILAFLASDDADYVRGLITTR